MNRRSHLASLVLPSAIALAALAPHAALTGDAEACSKGGAPAARHRFGALVETPSAVATDLVVIQSPVNALRTSTPLTPTEATIERADGSEVRLKASQVGDMPHASLGVVRSALVPEVPLEPNTTYTVVVRNLAQRTGQYADASLVSEPLRLPFSTGSGPRPLAARLVLQEGSPKIEQVLASETQACCKRTSCGTTRDNCVPRDRLTRELRDIRIVPANSPDAIVSVRVTTNRPADPALDEQGWTTTAGIRTLINYGNSSVEAVSLALMANEHACVVAVATDLFTGVETLSEPLCVDGPSTLPAATLDCKSITFLGSENQCTTRNAELDRYAAACAASPFPPSPASSSGPPGSGTGASDGCAVGTAAAASGFRDAAHILVLGAAAMGWRVRRARSRTRANKQPRLPIAIPANRRHPPAIQRHAHPHTGFVEPPSCRRRIRGHELVPSRPPRPSSSRVWLREPAGLRERRRSRVRRRDRGGSFERRR